MEETLYYLHINGQQRGPYVYAQLLSEGLTPETMVWKAGMPNWAQASTLPELLPLFNQPPIGQPQPVCPPGPNPYQNYGMPNQFGQYPAGWTNWMGWAITGTILGFLSCCIGLIFGIIAIVKSNQANTMARTGDLQRAYDVNNTAKTWTIVSLVLGILGLGWAIIVFITGIVDYATILSLYN